MDDSGLVEMSEHRKQLHEVALNLDFGETLATLEQLIHGLVVADFEKNVDILMVFEVMFEVNHMRVVQRLVDFDLGK